MKKTVLLFGILLNYLLASCSEENTMIVGPNGAAALYDLTNCELVRGEVGYSVPAEGAVFHFQDAIGFFNWKWAFFVKKTKKEEGEAQFDSFLSFDDYLRLSFEAKDESQINVQTIFSDADEKPYRYFDIIIPPNPTRTVREFSIELTPIPDRNYYFRNVRLNFTQTLGD